MEFISVIYFYLSDKKFIKNYSLKNKSCLKPWFITGFTDAEGCFNIHFIKSSSNLIGWQVQARYIIEVNIKDLDLLYKIKTFFGDVGSISTNKKVGRFCVQGIKDILNVVNHFDRYPLQSSKQIDYYLWKQCINIMLDKKHLTLQGLEEILAYKNCMNYGESKILKLCFPNITKAIRPAIVRQDNILDPLWVTGFIAGEGSFYVYFHKSTNKFRPVFSLGLNERDRFLLISINTFFKQLGSVYGSSSNNSTELKIFKFDNLSVFINHFSDYPLEGFKLYNFSIWSEIVEILKKKELTIEDMEIINNLRDKLNKWN